MRLEQVDAQRGPPQWLTGGAFGPEASIFAVLVDATAIVLMWRWKGTAQARPAMLPPAVAPANGRGMAEATV